MEPLQNLTLTELARQLHGLAGELRTPAQRTAEQRQQLARRTAQMLAAAADRVAPAAHCPGQPEYGLQGRPAALEEFATWYERLARASRYLVVQRAAEWVLGDAAREWLHDAALPHDQRRYAIAIATDGGLRVVLAQLQALHAAGADGSGGAEDGRAVTDDFSGNHPA